MFCVVISLLSLASPSGIPAIVDLGSAFTIANWAAGKLARLEPRGPHVRYTGQASQAEMSLLTRVGANGGGKLMELSAFVALSKVLVLMCKSSQPRSTVL